MDKESEDYLVAKRMQQQFDKEFLEVFSGEEDVPAADSVERDRQFAVRLQSRYESESMILLSDSDDDVILQANEAVGTSRDAVPATKLRKRSRESSAGTYKHTTTTAAAVPQLFKAEPSDLNNNEYFIDELQVYVDSENNFEWKFIDVLPDVRSIFNKFDMQFFESRFKKKKMDIIWCESMGSSCTNRNFNDDQGRYTIALNAPLLTLRPRIEIISIILHEMIHALLKINGIKEPNGGHGENFRKIMTFLNSKLQTNISFRHKLHNTSLGCRNQWYRCTGICQNYGPFYGIVRSVEGPPGLQNEWWKEHADSCGGTFYKIYEMSRIVCGEVSTRYAVNVRYMLPKRENIRCRYKTTLPPIESIDLTSDVPKVISTTILETVNVDDSEETPGTSAGIELATADAFIAHFERSIAFTRDLYEMQCPICQERIKRKLFSNHIDGCKGFVRVVQWKKSSVGTIVQNGLMEQKYGLHQPSSSVGRAFHESDSTVSSSSSFVSYQQAKRKRFG
uniref:Protein with SprT-like domain at the N terminus n=1 Tax=Anopheles epiroticus TaxID=199890 RepID=A0A182PR92_9DIPT